MNKSQLTKKQIFWLTLLTSSLVAVMAQGQSVQNNQAPQSELGRDFRFNPMDINGRYNVPGEALITVENEKILRDLLEVRGDFKDRIRQEMERR